MGLFSHHVDTGGSNSGYQIRWEMPVLLRHLAGKAAFVFNKNMHAYVLKSRIILQETLGERMVHFLSSNHPFPRAIILSVLAYSVSICICSCLYFPISNVYEAFSSCFPAKKAEGLMISFTCCTSHLAIFLPSWYPISLSLHVSISLHRSHVFSSSSSSWVVGIELRSPGILVRVLLL